MASVTASFAGFPVSGSTAAPAVVIGALADERARTEAPREAVAAATATRGARVVPETRVSAP